MSIEGDRRRRTGGRLRPYVRRAHDAVVREQAVRVRKTTVRERELGILDESFLEKLDGFQQPFFCPLIEVIATLQVEISRRQVIGRTSARYQLIAVGKHRLKFVDDDTGDALLRSKRIRGNEIGR